MSTTRDVSPVRPAPETGSGPYEDLRGHTVRGGVSRRRSVRNTVKGDILVPWSDWSSGCSSLSFEPSNFTFRSTGKETDVLLRGPSGRRSRSTVPGAVSTPFRCTPRRHPYPGLGSFDTETPSQTRGPYRLTSRPHPGRTRTSRTSDQITVRAPFRLSL